jgi:hypothetical protein
MTEVIGLFDDEHLCNEAALKFSKEHNIVKDDGWANLMNEAGIDGITSEKASEIQKSPVALGVHNFQGERGTELYRRRVEYGSHPFGSDFSKRVQKSRLEQGSHHFQDFHFQSEMGRRSIVSQKESGKSPFLTGEVGRANNQKMLNDGTHPFLNKERQKERAIKRTKEGHNPSSRRIWI